jgi:S-adenosyl methyltransferase
LCKLAQVPLRGKGLVSIVIDVPTPITSSANQANTNANVRFDPGIPNPARIYNVWLGGKDGLAADRKAAAEVAACRPQVVAGARANRAFLGGRE